MFDRICLVHYHEIGLKGRNRLTFERRLLDNLKTALRDYPGIDIGRISGRLLVQLGDPDQAEHVAAAIAQTPGVARVSCGWRTNRTLDEIYTAACLAVDEVLPFTTFKVAARRSNTDFPLTSMELNQLVGAHLRAHLPEQIVRMKNPDVKVCVEVVQGSTYIYARSLKGVGGLPVGSAGKVVCLLSAGLDSPVALWRMMRRGAVAVGLHFSGRPQTADTSEYLVCELAEALAPAAGIGRIYLVPFGDYQREIASTVPPALRIVFYRRLMFAVANEIADLENAKALVTGESLGQVASQTLENIRAVDGVARYPVFRPLIGNDKQEIIAEAERLGTFEISTRDHADCCTLFMPRSPETHANLELVERIWDELPTDAWISQIMAELEYRDFNCPAYRAPKSKQRIEKK